MFEIVKGDKITVPGIGTATVSEVLSQEVHTGSDNPRMNWIDLEFKDMYGNYRHWQSFSDGGKLTRKNGEVYEFTPE